MNGQLNLEPGFQRDSVWSLGDRKKLIHSIFQRYPVPSIFLWRSSENGRLVYHVLDGKQRLESMLMFERLRWFRGEGFPVRTRVEGNDRDGEWDWGRLQRKGYSGLSLRHAARPAVARAAAAVDQ